MSKKTELPKSRLESLYKDFRSLKDLNHDGYIANINTWKEYLISKQIDGNHRIVFSCGNELLEKLRLDVYGQPKSIDIVIDDLVDEKYMISLDSFYHSNILSIDGSNRSDSRLLSFINWLGFPKKRFISRKNEDTALYLKEIDFVVLPKLKEISGKIETTIRESIIDKASGLADLVFSISEFKEKSTIKEYLKSPTDQDVILFYLEQYINTIKKEGNVVKIIDPSAENILKNFSKDITEVDVSLVDVKITIGSLEKQIDEIENGVNKINVKQHSSAYKDLPRKTQLEYQRAKIVSQRYQERLLGYLNNLQGVKKQLDVSLTNQLLFDTLNKTKEAIKSVNNYIGSIDKVNDLLDDIRNESERADKINNALSETNNVEDDALEREIEEELAKLELENTSIKKGVKEDKEEEEILDKLKNLNITETDLSHKFESAKSETAKEPSVASEELEGNQKAEVAS